MTEPKITDVKTPEKTAQESVAAETKQVEAAAKKSAGKSAAKTARATKTAAKTARSTVSKTSAKTEVKKTPAKRRTTAKKATPQALAPENISLDSPSLYTNREISWIEFDRKVLETAMDVDVPLLERVKFLSIFFNNLDEFYMVRVMNLQRQARSGVAPTGADKMPPAKQLVEIRRRVSEMLEQAENLWLKELRPALDKKNVRFVAYESLSPKHRAILDKYFETEIFPVLTPQAVDAGRPFPMISSRSINFVIELKGLNGRKAFPEDVEVTTLLQL